MAWARRALPAGARISCSATRRRWSPRRVVAVGVERARSRRAWARSSCRASTKATSRCMRCASPARASHKRSRCSRRSKAHQGVPRSRHGVRQDRHGRDRHRPDAAERRRHLRDAEAAVGVARSDAHEGRTSSRAMQEAAVRAPRQQLRVHATDPDALQRADLRRAQRRRGQGVRRRLRHAARARASASRRSSRRIPRRRRREGRADHRAAGADREDRPAEASRGTA